jgi:Glycosyltransferase WbsX
VEIVAHYLPQFHPIPENDEWWEPGFTEWTNVARARPLFRGHVQPHLPADLGFYDLRVPEVREAQAAIARRYGVTGFCYWHYWFAGRLLLERPFEEVLNSGVPDLPFCLAWANRSWSGIWHGAPDRILIEQTYPGPEDDARHFAHLRRAFEDPRYIRVGGKPIFFVFMPVDLPDPAAWIDRWQAMATDAGLGGLYLVAMNHPASLSERRRRARLEDDKSRGARHIEAGFDAVVYYELPFQHTLRTWLREGLMNHNVLRGPCRYEHSRQLPEPPADIGGGTVIPCVYPNWDNTPRAGRRGVLAMRSTPERLASHVRRALEIASAAPSGEQVVLIKSWNEWAEGNYLEPDREYGFGRLEALAAEIERAQRLGPPAPPSSAGSPDQELWPVASESSGQSPATS